MENFLSIYSYIFYTLLHIGYLVFSIHLIYVIIRAIYFWIEDKEYTVFNPLFKDELIWNDTEKETNGFMVILILYVITMLIWPIILIIGIIYGIFYSIRYIRRSQKDGKSLKEIFLKPLNRRRNK